MPSLLYCHPKEVDSWRDFVAECRLVGEVVAFRSAIRWDGDLELDHSKSQDKPTQTIYYTECGLDAAAEYEAVGVRCVFLGEDVYVVEDAGQSEEMEPEEQVEPGDAPPVVEQPTAEGNADPDLPPGIEVVKEGRWWRALDENGGRVGKGKNTETEAAQEAWRVFMED